MLKIVAASFISIFFINIVYAQKSFNITIELDTSIIPKNVHYQYYDGKNTTFIPDTFGDRRVITFKKEYYSPFASFIVSYKDPVNNYYDNSFFITSMPSKIRFYFKANNQSKLQYDHIDNAVPIYDTVANKVWAKMLAFMTDTVVTKENKAFDLFLAQNKGFASNDSLTHIFQNFYKRRLNRYMLFLEKHPNDYFSFWYFTHQVAQPKGVLSRDKTYLKEQLAYLKSVFPAKYTESLEGKELIKAYEAKINPRQLNESVPQFTLTTIDGKHVSLLSLKGKYILLNFWATWCPPCMAEIPFLKEIRKKNSPEKLVIIGISADFDSKKLNAVVKNQEMSWIQFHDRNREISRLYGIEAYPTLILIDKEGRMIYESNLVTNDQDRLPKMLETLK
ncbi:TlpA family protein disulfide reductase [Mucilaginibacter psychrotolerans]|uniref:TlpA family protein disulfide reductase n=1 Tax=Mucilaginibacter psychrotolerans TaxID=1524096 RepID=A0A4Y8S4M5_9SPHI|nr:TlpA disulfide reductase family protein [Mucilaginibacter psychrotolerans]TFF33585.1 TlpA family protein disulfide reductase [Mucilaginibacter psychrotolerans]